MLLIAPADPVRAALADELGRSGDRVVTHAPVGECGCAEAAAVSSEDLARVVEDADPSGVAHIVRPWGASEPVPFEHLDISGWVQRVHDPLWSLVETVRIVRTGRAPIVVVVESTGLSGAPGATMSAALAEGARAIAKSAARTFGGDGPRVQTVAVDPMVFGSPDVIGETIRPRNRPAPTMVDLAEAIRAARDLPAAVAGGLIVVDGGRTMLP